jgi:hypothetical protein
MAYIAIVYESNIVRMIQIGDGATWTRDRAWEIRRYAVIYAPQGTTGRLKRSHKVFQNRDIFTGRFRKGFNILADARHARWVHDGTANEGRGWIRPRTKRAMRLPAGGGYPTLIRKRVRGQKPNPWLRRAGELVARRY